jgi:Coenzyme PQQ synthesis protein D (PqqD)
MRLRSSDISARAIDGETIILDLQSSRYLSVTGVGTRIVELLASDRTVDDLVATIADEYSADPGVVREDVQRFLGKLGAAGLLEA